MGHAASWTQRWGWAAAGWEALQWGPNQLKKQFLTFQGRIRPAGTRHMGRRREGLGQHKCGGAVSLSLCTEYNKNIFRKKNASSTRCFEAQVKAGDLG